MAKLSEGFAKSVRRYVQFIDQSLGRVEKSEVLSDEIQAMEKQTETIRQAVRDLIKPLQACLVPMADADKRQRKLPESAFSDVLFVSAGSLSENVVFATVFSRLSEAEKSLAEALIQYTVNVEKNVIEPLNNVVDNEIPSVTKLRKDLTKATLDMDAAKKAYAALQKQEQVPSGKLETGKQKMDAEEAKVVRCRDLLLTGLYQFYSREKKLCNLLLSVLQLQADYHRRSIEALERQILELKQEIEQNTVKPVYGCDLKEHLSYISKDIASVIEVCVKSIEKRGLDTEGLFRISPSQSKLRKLKAAFDANVEDIEDGEDIDVHCLAEALKLYLRELPEPLMTFELYNEWSSAVQSPVGDKREAILSIVKKLPKTNFDNLKYLMEFMAKVTSHSDSNKMPAKNLAIVIAPNVLYRSKAEQGGMEGPGASVTIVEALISEADWFFSDKKPEPPPVVVSNESEEKVEDDKGNPATEGIWNRFGNFLRTSLAPFRRRRRHPSPPLEKARTTASDDARIR